MQFKLSGVMANKACTFPKRDAFKELVEVGFGKGHDLTWCLGTLIFFGSKYRAEYYNISLSKANYNNISSQKQITIGKNGYAPSE